MQPSQTALREPVRASGWVTALAAVLTVAGVRLAGLEPGLAGELALAAASGIVGEVGRRLAVSPATAAAALAGEPAAVDAATEVVARDPGWLRRYWPVGLAVAALAFVGPEAFAIVSDGDGGTLSEWTRDQLGTSEGQATAGWWALTAVLAAFAVWFPVHLRRGWPWERGDRPG